MLGSISHERVKVIILRLFGKMVKYLYVFCHHASPKLFSLYLDVHRWTSWAVSRTILLKLQKFQMNKACLVEKGIMALLLNQLLKSLCFIFYFILQFNWFTSVKKGISSAYSALPTVLYSQKTILLTYKPEWFIYRWTMFRPWNGTITTKQECYNTNLSVWLWKCLSSLCYWFVREYWCVTVVIILNTV